MQFLTALCIFSQIYVEVHGWSFLEIDHGFRYLDEEFDEPDINVTSFGIRQPLDHFNKSINNLWGMKCYKSLDLWKPGGPIYLYMAGEWKASTTVLTSGMTYELAKETNGALFLSEHRFYGERKPIKEYDVKNLQFLSARQALADVAELVKWIKSQKKFKTSKVVVVGASYSANLAVWLKLLYPDLVDAAIASSAPVLAKLDYYEYLETVSDDYKKYGSKGCWDFIKKQFLQYEEAFKTDKGIENLKKNENICEDNDMNKIENQQEFFQNKIDEFMITAQFGFVHNITLHCEKIMKPFTLFTDDINLNKSDDSVKNHENQCLDIDFDKKINELRKGEGIKTYWLYQECNEFSYAKSTSSPNHPFTNNMPIENFYKTCSMVFGNQFSEESIKKSVEETNKLYQGLKPNVKNVIFVNGELDPWHRLSVLGSLSEDAPAIFIPKASHCMDLRQQTKYDPPELIEARMKIKQTIKKWIGVTN